MAGIYDMYGACKFDDAYWKLGHAQTSATLPSGIKEEFINRVFAQRPVPITGGVSLEGQASGRPDYSDPRQAYARTQIARGRVMEAIFPSQEWDKVDPLRNVTPSFPPTCIVHGLADTLVPARLSRALLDTLQKNGVQSKMVEIPGEEHIFAARMKVGSETWNLQRQGFDFLESLIK